MAFFVPSFNIESYDYSLISDVFTDYFTFERKNVFDIAGELFELSKNNNPLIILENIQNYILCLIKNNTDNKSFIFKLINDLKEVETAKKQVQLNINTQNVFENLCLNIIK